MHRPYIVQAPAKINLTLDVLGKRADGYHDLASVMVTIGWCDTLMLWPAPDSHFSLNCNREDLGGEDNLALRAARLIAERTGCTQGIHIELLKAIPTQGGLGGGSSDAAAVLLALNRQWQLGLTTAELIELAAQLGSDVPFFIHGGTALVEGRGERVTPLPDVAPFWLVVVKPAVAVPTPAIFRALTPAGWTNGTATRELVARLQTGEPPEMTEAALVNALEPVARQAFPAVAQAQQQLLAAGAPVVRMSGSGPTLFVPCATLAQATSIHQAASVMGLQGLVTHPLPR